MKREKPIEPLSEQEIAKLIRAAKPATLTGSRARALVSVLAFAGLRIGEALALRPKDIDLEAGTIAVLRGKGAKQRVAALLPEGAVHVERWLRRRASVGLNGAHPVFCTVTSGHNVLAGTTQPGKPLARAFVHQQLKRLARMAGIERRVHPHGLRHSHAHLLVLRGKLLPDVQAQLGHASLAMTSAYVNSFSGADRVGRLRDEEPRRQPAVRRVVEALDGLSGEDVALLVDLLRSRQAGAEKGVS